MGAFSDIFLHQRNRMQTSTKSLQGRGKILHIKASPPPNPYPASMPAPTPASFPSLVSTPGPLLVPTHVPPPPSVPCPPPPPYLLSSFPLSVPSRTCSLLNLPSSTFCPLLPPTSHLLSSLPRYLFPLILTPSSLLHLLSPAPPPSHLLSSLRWEREE
jgi:hypothetical protein